MSQQLQLEFLKETGPAAWLKGLKKQRSHPPLQQQEGGDPAKSKTARISWIFEGHLTRQPLQTSPGEAF